MLEDVEKTTSNVDNNPVFSTTFLCANYFFRVNETAWM